MSDHYQPVIGLVGVCGERGVKIRPPVETPFSRAVTTLYSSFAAAGSPHGVADQWSRDPSWAVRLFGALDLLDRPYPVSIVAGSKGKGSTVRQAVAILASAGLRVGWVTSPHLVDYSERFRINEATIDEASFIRYVAAVRPMLERLQVDVPAGGYIGPHAGILAVALLWFREQGIDVAVIEGGRGGRFDEVTALRAEVAAIPSVLLEHRRELGPRLADVAWHKAGVLPPDGHAVVGAVGPTAHGIIAQEAAERRSVVDWYGRNLFVSDDLVGIRIDTPLASYRSLELGLRGGYQRSNAAVAVRVAELLMTPVQRVSLPAAVSSGLSRVRSPGRLQEENVTDRHILLDTAIHRSSVDPIVEWMRSQRALGRRVVAVVSVPTDKDWRGVVRRLAAEASSIVFGRPVGRPMPFDEQAIMAVARQLRQGPEIVFLGAQSALAAALEASRPGDAVACIGTQSFIGQMIATLDLDATAFLATTGSEPAPR